MLSSAAGRTVSGKMIDSTAVPVIESTLAVVDVAPALRVPVTPKPFQKSFVGSQWTDSVQDKNGNVSPMRIVTGIV